MITPELVERRIALLTDFLTKMKLLGQTKASRSARYAMELGEDPQLPQAAVELREALTRMCIPLEQAVRDATVSTSLIVQGPPMIGSPRHSVEIFGNLFNRGATYDQDIRPFAIDAANKALGFYEALREGNGLVRIDRRDGIDIVSAVDRSLRPAFRDEPSNEKAVQDEVATILRAIGVDFNREQDRAAVGTTTFIPDFTVPDLDLAIEVKLTNARHGEAAAQREIAEDVAAFRTRWKRLLAIVYDVGAIREPDKIKREFENHFGVQIVIIKH